MKHSLRITKKGYYWGMNEQQLRCCEDVIVLENGEQVYKVGNKESVIKLIKQLTDCLQYLSENENY